jgi:hypothetical protein
MKNYRIDIFKFSDGTWKAVVYKGGSYMGEAKGSTEGWAFFNVCMKVSLQMDRDLVDG